ncbi:hypothetical protein JW988_07455 [Candidatus Bathyarchaeota archaeon]|nr:hypothetical protein [Candidatus Bathyarchaeota archaeon]
MKFGDVLTAVATYAVLQIVIAFLLTVVVLPVFGVLMFTYYGAGLTAVFLSMLIVGYLFRDGIKEGGRNAILRILVLSAFYELLVVVFQPALADWIPFAVDLPKDAFDGTVVTTMEWFLYSLSRRGNMVFNILIVIGLGFIGLYVGLKLKRVPNG